MLNCGALAHQLPVEDWVLLPTKYMPKFRETLNRERAYSRYIRHILFDLGGGKFTNLTPEQHKIVLAHCRRQYQGYVLRCKAKGKKVFPFRHTRCGAVRWWKWRQYAAYVHYDVPKKLKEFARVA